MTPLAITVLGGLEIKLVGADAPLKLPTRKSKALLVYLALSPGMTRSREHLAGALWDRSAEEQARASLRQTLSSLRKALSVTSTPVIDTDAHAVWLDAEAVEVDAICFERLVAERSTKSLEEAVSIYQGDLLGGFSLREESFEEWIGVERRRFRELAVQAFSDLLSHYARSEDFDRGIRIADRLLALDPLQEWAHCALMRLYWRTGRREAALRQYQECARILNRELGIAPAEETQRLAREIGREPDERGAPGITGAGSSGASRHEPPTVASLSPEVPHVETPPALPAERKDLTVLCARIRETMDNTDPEAALVRVDPLLEAMVDAVHRFGGTISHIRGDGVTALFGAPRAHEDHAVQACYAALAMREAVPSITDQPLDLRIGIHSGEVVVRTIGDERSRNYDAVGPVPHIASHIDASIDSGQIAITSETCRRAEGFVELSPLGARSLEDVRDALELYGLRARSAVRLRWEARSARELTRFVGRETETARLRHLLERARNGSGQVVTMVGDPGIGKSRVVHELVTSPLVADCMVLETGTTSHDTSAIYLPLSNLLRSWFGIGEHDAKPEAAEKLRSGLSSMNGDLVSVLPPLFALLDLPAEDPQWSTLSPPQKRQRTLEGMKTIVKRQSQMRPLVVVVEDLHWIDAGTQAVLDHLVETLGASRVLLLFTHRPEYRHNWFAKTYFTQLRLEPLSTSEVDRLLRTLLGDDPSLAHLRRELVERTAGTPLFIEESVRSLADAGTLVGTQGAYRLTTSLETFHIPSTVQAVLAARIDRLPETAKDLLQTAAVIGNDVPIDLLMPISGLDENSLRETLVELQAAELIYETRLPPNSEYTFKHALTRQVAYETVLKERRRAVHVRLVDMIEEFYADHLDAHVERLAHHALGGELWSKAVGYLYDSATKAIQRSAHLQAIQYLTKGLEIIETLPASRERLKLELDFQKLLGVTMMAARGWAAKEVLDAYTRARQLCEELGDERELFAVLRGEGQYRMIRGESGIARELGDRCVELAASSEDIGVHIESHHLFWTNSFFMGDYPGAHLHSTKGVELYERNRDHALTYLYSGHDPGVCCRAFLAMIQCLRGYPDQSLGRCREALELAEQLNHPLTTALAQWAYSYVYLFRREPEAAREWAEKEIAVCDEYLLPLLHSHGTFQLGWALAELGELKEGIEYMRQGIAANKATGAEMGAPYFSALLGEALGKAGAPNEGLEEVDKALATANRNRARFQISEILRLKGELLMMLSRSNAPEAEACFRDAVGAAEEQGANLPRLRSAASLARLLEHKGESVAGKAVLKEACEALTEGIDTVDLMEGKALLEALGSP